MVERVSAGPIYIDGPSTRDHRSQVLSQRKDLSKDGVVVIVMSTDRKTGQPLGEVRTVSTGFMDASETGTLFKDLGSRVSEAVNGDWGLGDEPDQLTSKVRETARRFIFGETRRRPIIIPVVLEV